MYEMVEMLGRNRGSPRAGSVRLLLEVTLNSETVFLAFYFFFIFFIFLVVSLYHFLYRKVSLITFAD